MMNRPINVLLLDDDKDDILPDLKMSAKSHRVLIKESFRYANEGIDYIKHNHSKIDAIILDGFCLSEPGSSRKKNLRALKETVEELKKLLYRENLNIPYCVLTGFLEDISNDSLLSDIEVFQKGDNNKEMYDYLKNEVAKNPEYQIKNKFDEVFQLFDKNLLPEDKEDDLVEILKKLKSKAKYNSDDAFNPIRKMYEVFVESLYSNGFKVNTNQDLVDKGLLNKDYKLENIWGSYHYLSGRNVNDRNDKILIHRRDKPVWPEHVENNANHILKISQRNSHNNIEDIHHYTYKSVAYALLELLLWYKEFITNYKKEYTNG